MSLGKGIGRDVLVDWVVKDLLTAFKPLAAQGHALHGQGFSCLVCQAVPGNSCVKSKSLPAVLEGKGAGVLKRLFQTCISCP